MNDWTIVHHDPLLEGEAEVAAGDVHDDDVDHNEDDDEEEHLEQVIVGRHGGSGGELVTYYSNNFLTLCVILFNGFPLLQNKTQNNILMSGIGLLIINVSTQCQYKHTRCIINIVTGVENILFANNKYRRDWLDVNMK